MPVVQRITASLKGNRRQLARFLPRSATAKTDPAAKDEIEHSYYRNEVLPLYFLHIAKTGGTSLTAALRAFYCADDVISEAGNVSLDFVKANEHRFAGGTFLHGHAGHEVMSYLAGRVRAITLLRNPKAQAVSNYLYLVRETNNPLSVAAINLGFKGFITTFWQYAIYQAFSLDVSISRECARFPEEMENRIGQVFNLLDKLFFAGQLEHVDELCPLLSLLLHLPGCLKVPRLNTAAENGVDEDTLDRLGTEYDRLQDNAEIAHLLALEWSIYQKAGSLREKYKRWLVEQAFGAKRAVSASPFAGYVGVNGTVYLAGNWQPPETTSEGRGWWTGSEERSTLLIEMIPDVVALEAEVYVTHFVSTLVFEANGLALGYSVQAAPDDPRRIRVDLRPLAHGRHWILTLRIAREAGPSVPPYYPALALRHFRLV